MAAAAEPSQAINTPSTTPLKTNEKISSPNAYSILQNLSRQGDSASVATRNDSKTILASAKGPRPAASKRGERSTISASSSDTPLLQLSSFRPTSKNLLKSDGVTKLDLSGERLLILGSYGVRVLKGEVTMVGATIKPSDLRWVYAPHIHAIPVLRSLMPATIELHPDPLARNLRDLGRLSPLFRRIWNELDEDPIAPGPDSTFRILYRLTDAPKKSIVQDLKSPPEWNKKLMEIVISATKNSSFSTLVCGPKSSGKSTFSRLLTNRLLNDINGVAIIDLDPGQPEYACPGTLSLVHVTEPNLSPPFVHTNQTGKVLRCHALAAVSPSSDPDFYQECAIDLYEKYCQKLAGIPLIINTPGWVLGTGLALLEMIIGRIAPSQVVYMSEDGPAETVDALRRAARNTFDTVQSQQSEFTTRTAAHLRAMQTMSYFHHRAIASGRQAWDPSPLSTIVPLQVRYSGPQSGILGILSYNYQPPPELLAEAINGMVLAAVEIEDPKALHGLVGIQPAVPRTPEGLPFIPNPDDLALDPRFSNTIGFVLVRGIDSTTESLQIITPVPLPRIQGIRGYGRQIVFVHGKFDAPAWAYTEDLHCRSTEEENANQAMDIEDQDTSDDDSEVEPDNMENAYDVTAIPWLEALRKNQRRPVGSKVWRVRRNLL